MEGQLKGGGREAPAPGLQQALRGRRPAWAEIDLDALARNLDLVRRRIGPDRRVLAVVKANAYGHGAVAVSRRLERESIDLLGVALPEEGHALRRAGIRAPILVLGAADAGQIRQMLDDGLVPTAFSLTFLEALIAAGRRLGRSIPFHLKVDTGMGRLGIQPGEVTLALDRIAAATGRGAPEGILTHLSCSDDPDDPHTPRQIGVFLTVLEEIRSRGIEPGFVHAASSGGVIDHHPSWFNLVRPGIALYGLHPSARSTRLDLSPVLSLKTRIVLVKSVEAGTPLGYGRSFVTARRSVIGTVAAGYADGLNRMLSNRGAALVRGHRAAFAGLVSMDHASIDLTDVPGAAEGDEVVLIGRQAGASIGADEFAGWAGTIPYEILCNVGDRVPRVYIEDGAVSEIV